MPRALSVLHVTQPTDGGVGRFVRELAAVQAAANWDVTVACPQFGELQRELVEIGVRVVTWAAEREPGREVVREASSLAYITRRAAPDLVHLHSSKAGLVGRLCIRRRRPTIFQPHGWSFLAAKGPTARAARAWEAVAARWADAIWCVSASEQQHARDLGLRDRLCTLHHGVDLERFPFADEHARADARRVLGLGAQPLVACVGRLCEQKGQDVLLAAWQKVAAVVPGATLLLVGDGPSRSALERLRVPSVRFVRQQANVQPYLAACDVVAIPSRWEGMPFVVLEAMATGRSVVASDVEGLAEALGSIAGEAIAPNNSDLLATALVRRLQNPQLREREGAAGRSRSETLFDICTRAPAYLAVSEAVAKRLPLPHGLT